MKYDKPLMAALIMILITIPAEAVTQVFKYLGLNQLSACELTSIMMYSEGSWWIGLWTLPGTAGRAGVLIYEMGRKFGTDYFPLKAAGITTVTYGLIAAVFGTLGRNPRFATLSIAGHFVQASVSLLGGLLAGFLIKKYLFNRIEVSQSQMVRRYSVVPSPALKKELKEIRVRLIKPKKL